MMANYMPQEDRLEDIDLRAWPEGERRFLIETMPAEFDEHIFDDDDDDDAIDYLDAFAMSTNVMDFNDSNISNNNSNGPLGKRQPTELYMDGDASYFTPFQVLLRKNIEFFEAKQEDLDFRSNAVLGQVGLRCRACSQLPMQQRHAAASIFPTGLDQVLPCAQQLAGNHVIPSCSCLSNDIRAEMLQQLGQSKELSRPGDGALWVQRCRDLGVFEDQNRLRFFPQTNDIPPVDMGVSDFEW